MCERWRDSFEAFYEDMGDRPSGMSLERINTAKGYEPGNCRWATAREQSANRRNTVLVLVDGQPLTLSSAAEVLGLSYGMALHYSRTGKLVRVPNPYQQAAA